VLVPNDRATSTQITDLNARLSEHLTHCRMKHAGFEELLDEFARTLNASRAAGVDVPAAVQAGRQHASRVNQAWDLHAERAALAAYFIGRFIFNPQPDFFTA
jgi:acetyl esterase/lipase